MDSNLANRFTPYEAFTWNQNPMNVTPGLFPTWHRHNQLNHQLINHVTPTFNQDTERTHAIPAADNIMATPSTSNTDVDCQSNRHNFYGTQDYQAGISELKVQLDNERKKQNNARERGRIRYINDEFDALQKLLKPWLNGFAPKTKLNTLRYAADLIEMMTEELSDATTSTQYEEIEQKIKRRFVIRKNNRDLSKNLKRRSRDSKVTKPRSPTQTPTKNSSIFPDVGKLKVPAKKSVSNPDSIGSIASSTGSESSFSPHPAFHPSVFQAHQSSHSYLDLLDH